VVFCHRYFSFWSVWFGNGFFMRFICSNRVVRMPVCASVLKEPPVYRVAQLFGVPTYLSSGRLESILSTHSPGSEEGVPETPAKPLDAI